jgi:hypothetical protein
MVFVETALVQDVRTASKRLVHEFMVAVTARQARQAGLV